MAYFLDVAFLLVLLVLPATGRCDSSPFSYRLFLKFLRLSNTSELHQRRLLSNSLEDKNKVPSLNKEEIIDRLAHNAKVARHNIQSEKARIVRLTSGRKDKRLDWPDLDIEACAGASLPKEAMLKKGGKFDTPIDSINKIDITSSKYLLVYPKLGLGNSLRGYTSAFVFSLLSGRRLVIMNSGPQSKVYKVLCEAFYCFSDMIIDDKNGTISRSIKNTFHPILIKNIKSTKALLDYVYNNGPILDTHSSSYFDTYWTSNETLRNCVLKTLKCKNIHCVRSQAMEYLIGEGPRKVLGNVIEEFVQGVESNRIVSSIQSRESRQLKFDVGIQIRTGSRSVEGYSKPKKECLENQTLCEEEIKTLDSREMVYNREIAIDKIKIDKISNSPFWNCSREFFEKVRSEIKNEDDPEPILNVFVATDNEELRPHFVNSIKQYKNVVYFSSGSVAHTAKRKGNVSPMPTMAEFFLLGRSSYLLSYSSYVSSFALGAAQYGNGTLVAFHGLRKKNACSFAVYNY